MSQGQGIPFRSRSPIDVFPIVRSGRSRGSETRNEADERNRTGDLLIAETLSRVRAMRVFMLMQGR
jgi:hypothetical protein